MSRSEPSFDGPSIRAKIAKAIAEEARNHQLRDALRQSASPAGGDVEIAESVLRVQRAIEAVPDRLAVVASARAFAEARERITRIVRAIDAYWDDPDDVVADRHGLLGLIDDALVCHALLDRLNRWHLETMGADLAPQAVPWDLSIRRLLADETERRIMRVVDDIWEGQTATPRVQAGDEAHLVLLRELKGTVPIITRRGERAIPPARDKVSGSPEDAPRLFEVWFGTNRTPIDPGDDSKGFGGERDNRVHYGVCEVAIPKTHKFGSIGTAWWKRWMRLEFADDRVKIVSRRPLDDKASFIDDLRQELASSQGRQVLFYLHGFNVSFDDAAVRAAQLFADLKMPGAAAFFSWPSKASVDDYPADLERVGDSEGDIAAFLTSLATELDGATVHIIAHSMGNRGLARAIQRITGAAARSGGVRFGQIILAAPDLSVTLFEDLAAIYPALSQRTTMYVSARDRALGLSKWLQDAPRAGFTPPVTVVPNIDTIEVTNIDVTLLGHGYYAEAAPVLYDIGELLRHDSAPDTRQRLQAAPAGGASAKYWLIGA